MKVGFVGLGRMGSGMAASVLKAGHQVTVYNRAPSKADALVEQGALAASRLAEASAGEAVITMLANDGAVESVVYGADGILANLPKNAIHISMSTISVALSERLTKDHAKAGQRFVAAPVFGRPDAAAAGGLLVVAAGDKKTVEDMAPVLDAIGRRTCFVSEEPKAANLVKLSGNFLIASVIEALGEAIALVSKGDVDLEQYLEVITSGLFDTPIYKTYGKLITDGIFEPAGFAAPLGYKDIKLVLEASDELRVPMPFASLLRNRFLNLLAHEGDKLDWSAIGGLAARDAGAA